LQKTIGAFWLQSAFFKISTDVLRSKLFSFGAGAAAFQFIIGQILNMCFQVIGQLSICFGCIL
jgi:hypothetical protein